MGVIRFWLLGIRVHIQPGFWVVAALLVLATAKGGNWAWGLLFGSTVLLAILIHELGHAFAARRCGLDPVIVVHAFGGMTSWLPGGAISQGQAIAIALAGPSSGLLVAGLCVLVVLVLGHSVVGSPLGHVRQALGVFAQVNGIWSLINLLPTLPFDAGQVLILLLGPKRRGLAAHLSLVAGTIAVAILFALRHNVVAALLGAAVLVQYVAVTRKIKANSAGDLARLELLLARARGALQDGDTEMAEKAARAVIDLSAVAEQRRQAAEVFAWAALGRGHHHHAKDVLEILTAGPLDPLLQAAILEADGDVDRATTCLRQARVAGDTRPQVAASLVRLLLSADRYGEAALTTIQILDHVTVQEARRVIQACRDGGRPIPAAELGMALFARTASSDDLAWALVSYSASGNREAVERVLATAAERKVPAQVLLGSSAFEAVEVESDLRRLVTDGAMDTSDRSS